jgi:hypothetical protein
MKRVSLAALVLGLIAGTAAGFGLAWWLNLSAPGPGLDSVGYRLDCKAILAQTAPGPWDVLGETMNAPDSPPVHVDDAAFAKFIADEPSAFVILPGTGKLSRPARSLTESLFFLARGKVAVADRDKFQVKLTESIQAAVVKMGAEPAIAFGVDTQRDDGIADGVGISYHFGKPPAPTYMQGRIDLWLVWDAKGESVTVIIAVCESHYRAGR